MIAAPSRMSRSFQRRGGKYIYDDPHLANIIGWLL